MNIIICFLVVCCLAQMVLIHQAIKVINQWKDLVEVLEKEAEEWKELAHKAVDVMEDNKEPIHDTHGTN